MRIFVVENHPDTLKYLKIVLESMGHSVTTACTMQAALAASPTEDCHVLISDLGLPDGDGWQLMEQAQFPQPVYAVAMSGFAAESDLKRSKAAGFRRHIVKPFSGEDLREALDEAAREIKARTPEDHPQATPPPTRKKPGAGKALCLTPGQIADRLHHSTCQSLFSARLLLCVVRKKLPQDAADVLEQLGKLDHLLDESCAGLSALMEELRTAPERNSEAKTPPKKPTPLV